MKHFLLYVRRNYKVKAKKTDVSHKLKVARGQLDGILKMVDENRYCVDISNQLLATQALLKSANQEIMQAHIRSCVAEALQTDKPIVFAGSLFVNFFQSANMVIRGEGQLKKAMSIIASGAILNIILDPIFITILKPYGMGIEAAAFATILSQFVQAVITLWYFRKKSPNVKIGRIRIDGELLPQVLSVGVSALLMQILTLVQQTVIYRVAANYGGETSQILLGAALRFWNFSFVPLWGISQGFQPAAGTNYGAKDYDRVKTLTKVFVIAATVLSLIFYIPAELFPAKVLSMFITTPGVAASGATNFRIMFSTYVLQGSFMIAVTLFQSLGKANKATWLVLFRQIILFIPLCVLLPMIGGMRIRGVWLAISLTDAILVVITISMMISEFRKMPSTVMAKR